MPLSLDCLIGEIDRALRTVSGAVQGPRKMPGSEFPEADLSDGNKRHVAALMRVNHSGEVCAQALYRGQALASSSALIREALAQSAAEEGEHLAWTERRLVELGGKRSLLNPLWYAGSLALGVIVGKLGNAWSLGFLAETERQVETHLERHLKLVPKSDRKSWAIIEQMKSDEIGHSHKAERLGARELPDAAKLVMKLAAGAMTRTAYWV